MKMKEIKSLNIEELKNKIYLLKKDLFVFLKDKSIGQFKNNYRIKEIKKDIARLKTYLNLINKK